MVDVTSPPTRLLSIAAGVTPELGHDPVAFVDAAIAVGWPATGIWYDAATWTSSTTADLARRFDESEIVPLDMEVVRMGSDADCGEALVDVAAALGVRNILTISSFGEVNATVDRFGELCRGAAPAGIRVCIEFMVFTSVKTLADALHVVDQVAEPNAGILVDLLHVVRSGTSFEEIAAVDPALFPYVQWCDGPAEPRGWDTRQIIGDALDDRLVPGRGELGALQFSDLFPASVPFSLEVRSKALRDAFPDPTERAAYLLAETRAALSG